MSTEFDHDDLADLDGDDVEQLAVLSDEDLAAALDELYDRNPLAFYATPVTRRCKPYAYGRAVVDVLRSL
ncbi:hypothetical protein [Streptomyces sp. NPDC002386]